VTTINFVYRYTLIVRNRTLSGLQYIGLLATMLLSVAALMIYNRFLTVPTDTTEFVMTDEYIEIFGGQNFTTKSELRTCIRGDMVTN
jgi:hypothetical protein